MLPPLLKAERERGLCRVLCFHPDHSLTLARMTATPTSRRVVDAWVDEYSELMRRPGIGYAQIFENRGAMMGCSNPHPHCQIWAPSAIPNEVAKEHAAQKAYFETHGRTLLSDYVALELEPASASWPSTIRLSR